MWNLKNEINKIETDSQIQRTDGQFPEKKGVWGPRKKGEGIKYKLVVIKQSQGCKVWQREYSQQYCNNYVWCQVDTGNVGGNIL